VVRPRGRTPSDVETVGATEDTTVTLSDEDRAKSDQAYDQIALSIAAYEASPEVNAFTSKDHPRRQGQALQARAEGDCALPGHSGVQACHPSSGLGTVD
jgi:hypothetical protein